MAQPSPNKNGISVRKAIGIFVLIFIASAAGYKMSNPDLNQVNQAGSSDVETSIPSNASVPSKTPTSTEPDEIKGISDIDFASYDRELARWVGLEVGDSLTEANAKIEAYFSPGAGRPEGHYSGDPERELAETSFSTVATDGGTVIVAERSNLKDDSVKSERLYLITKKFNNGEESVVDYGMKIKCMRGANTEQWTIDLCP